MTDTEKMRNEFELNALNSQWGLLLTNFDYSIDGSTVTYIDGHTQLAWQSWRAAALLTNEA